ncbi:hypothetical protein AB0M38_18805 [Streptomyces sp. NPDC051742]|uniref:hypothetical protein n=1 Tax=unclassified Streptomyces TaxID=2593676 RepID=UPI003449DB70
MSASEQDGTASERNGTASERAGTAEALDRYRRRAALWVKAGAAVLAAGVALGVLSVDSPAAGWVPEVLPYPLAGGAFALLLGLGAQRLARRMRRVLGAGDWSAHAVVALPKGVVVLAGPEPGVLLPRQVVAVKERYARVEPGPDGVLWWCGDPLGGGVIAPPGGGELVWTRPVRSAGARRRAVALAELRGLAERPAIGMPTPLPAAASPALPYAALAEAARRQAVAAKAPGQTVAAKLRQQTVLARLWRPRRNRPEPDVRTVAWWRVRGLREISGLSWTAGTCAIAAALLGVTRLGGEDAGMLGVFGLFMAAGACVNVFRLLTSGVSAARLLARTAGAPVAVPKRYVVLADPYGGSPVLVVFAPHGGPEDQPEGALPLLRSSAPGEPAGEVELHGWLDLDTRGRPLVVARASGGRVLWPREPYLEAGTPGFAEVARWLAPPQEEGVPVV